MRSIMIHSDGYGGAGTVILDEDGNKLERVYSADVHIEAQQINTVTLEVQHCKMNTSASVTEINFLCPVCSESFEHHCDTQLGGVLRSTNPAFDFEICGERLGNDRLCYIEKGVVHDSHFDVRSAVMWTSAP